MNQRTPIQGTQTVAAAGTPVALVARGANSNQSVRSIEFTATKDRATDNAGNVFIGFGTATQQLRRLIPGETWNFKLPGSERLCLCDIYLDSATNGDGVCWTAIV